MDKIEKIKRAIKIIRWISKNPKDAIAALEEAAIYAENKRLVDFFNEVKRWQQN